MQVAVLTAVGASTIASIPDLAHASTIYLGDPIDYGYGIVQVQITVDNTGRITKIDTPKVSDHGSNASYTNYALPILITEALTAQSAKISGVSGASYISTGWKSSLASAIAQLARATTVATPMVSQTPTPTPTPTPIASTPPPLVLKPGVSVIQKTITCTKGATVKLIRGLAPKCPTGFTLKKR